MPTGIVLAIAALAVTSAQAATARITLKPAVGHPSASVTIKGTGFPVSASVTIDFDASPVTTTSTDVSGGFTTAFTVPASATPGAHTVTATSGTVSAHKTFTVETDWAHDGFDNTNANTNPYENVITTGNVGTMTSPWQFTTGGYVAQPAVVGGVAYFGSTDHNLYAVDVKTGTKDWSFTTGDNVTTTPAVVGNTVYFGSIDNYLYAVNRTTGLQEWKTLLNGHVLSSPTVSGGVVYVGSNNHQIIALDASTGTINWAVTTGNIVEDSPTVVGKMVYVGSVDGELYALKAASGVVKWHRHYDGQTTKDPTVYPIYYSPAYVNGVLYVADGPFVHALKPSSGGKLWTYKLHIGKTNVNTSPLAVADGHVYFGSLGGLVTSVDAATGGQDWQTFDTSVGQPTVANGVLFLPETSSQYLDALDASTGTVLHQFPEGAPLSGADAWTAPAVSDGVVYAGATDGLLHAFKP